MNKDTPRVTVPVDPRVRLAGYVAGTFKYTAWRGAAPEGEPTLTRDISALLSAANAPEGGAVEDLREALIQADLKIRSLPGADQSDVEFIRAALSTREEAPAEAGERRVSSEAELKRVVRDLITHRRAGDYDLMADDVANCLWPHLRAQPPARSADLDAAIKRLSKAQLRHRCENGQSRAANDISLVLSTIKRLTKGAGQ